jgi:hypothetical protein
MRPGGSDLTKYQCESYQFAILLITFGGMLESAKREVRLPKSLAINYALLGKERIVSAIRKRGISY